MKISKELNGTSLKLAIEGRLDTTTAPDLDKVIKTSLDGINDLVFDFAELAYISSAGLRVILAAQKVMSKQGSLVIKNVNDDIREVFEITGFCDILTIE